MILPKNRTKIFSLELFPPKDEMGLNGIYVNLGRFSALKPDFISVTYGAGGSERDKTIEIAGDIQNKFGIKSIAHLTAINSSESEIDMALESLKASGIKNILALRGDKKENNTATHFRYATDIIEYINRYNYFTVSAAIYPEGHTDSANFDQDIEIIRKKYDLGVTHFISQLFFDNQDFLRLRDIVASISDKIVIEAGIMPMVNAKQIVKMVSLSGAKLPPKLTKLIAKFGNGADAFRAAGINYAIEQITELLVNDIDGIHLYSMNNIDISENIYQAIKSILES